ncbi:MAG: response regulator [Phycisphaerae bacterium]|nr:response regulator [Phycisphaerae bacterium]
MIESVTKRSADILMVEDNPGDAMLVEECLKNSRTRCRVHVMEDGVEAMAFLHREGKYADVPRPDLIFLDLHVPRKDGREVLQEIKNDDALKAIPVIVFTSSTAEEDLTDVYDLRANCCVIKPTMLDQLQELLQAIEAFWFETVRLPSPK